MRHTGIIYFSCLVLNLHRSQNTSRKLTSGFISPIKCGDPASTEEEQATEDKTTNSRPDCDSNCNTYGEFPWLRFGCL